MTVREFPQARASQTDLSADPKSTQSSGDKTTAEPASKTAERTAKETGKKTDSADNTKSVTKTGDKSEASASETGTQTGKKAKSTKKADKTEKASKTSSVSIDPAGAQGAISMITPAMTSSTYIKIGDEVTFVWNYTNLIVTPSKIDVVASNTDGAWTIASNITCKETGSVVWNTSDEATPLPMESYTFIVYDSEEGPTAVPKAGHLSPYQNYPFAMYSPRNPEGTGSKLNMHTAPFQTIG